ncbi:methyl-accepting chemotaxis protein [Cognaticolwellia aestuarii]|uniref:methyl-accepting chemotaxis protein n=1 Tax=Cognaticolwellia aestuarii TaxID=329993 RepID=UPI000985BE37|nr:HAMP domain-containing methyl-accepting chemotaxis protein [Cognaticolwellia aestuarii]
MKLTIKQKLYVIVSLVILGLLGLYLENAANQTKVTNLVEIKSELKDLQIAMLQLRRSEKDFLLRKNVKYQQTFSNTFKHALQLINGLEQRLVTTDFSGTKLSVIKNGLQNYQQIFEQLIAASTAQGLDRNSGFYGKLRNVTHSLEENIAAVNDYESHIYLLTLRRHEKDFILRHEEKYLGRLLDTADKLKIRLSTSVSQNLLSTYINEFKKYFEISNTIGLDENSGIRGSMRAAVNNVESELKQEITRLNSYISESIEQSHSQHLAVTLIVSLLIAVVVIIVAQQIIAPLNSFSKRISEIRKGNDLTQRTEERHDEIGTISKEFNIFMAHFQTLIVSINQTVDALSVSSSVVSKSVAKTTEGIVNQSHESDMVATAVTEMGIVAGEIANNARLTKEKTDEASVKALEGKEKLDGTVVNINELSAQLINAGEEIVQLQEKSNGITSVLEVIKGIADQTNLLALNAAIEAARAGEQGRGFAVVADEVRTLAIRTQDSTAEITNIINELQVTTSEIVNTVGICKAQGLNSVTQAQETEEVLNEIITDVNAIAEMTVLVATAVEQQSIVVKEVDENIIRIRDIGEQVASDSQENSIASDDVAALASELHQEASIFKIK